MKFKKGDLVRVIRNEDPYNSDLVIKGLYVVVSHEDKKGKLVELNDCFNTPKSNIRGGYHPWRFKKASKEDLTEKERFEYIKYKLGVRDECQKKQKK